MPKVKIVAANSIYVPWKFHLVCDMNEGEDFADPLDLFQNPDYDPFKINRKGLYAIGGKIDVESLIKSYKFGIFPWYPYKFQEEVNWYCPRRRYVIFPDKIHVGHSLRNILNKNKYHITINQTFEEVIHNCRIADSRDENTFAWLGDQIEDTFIELNKRGYAKSVELWEGETLVGGFYGFWYKGIFQGESMFSLRPSASQVALILFCRQNCIDGEKIKLIDTQFITPTFKRLGGEYISYKKYRTIMDMPEDSDCGIRFDKRE